MTQVTRESVHFFPNAVNSRHEDGKMSNIDGHVHHIIGIEFKFTTRHYESSRGINLSAKFNTIRVICTLRDTVNRGCPNVVLRDIARQKKSTRYAVRAECEAESLLHKNWS